MENRVAGGRAHRAGTALAALAAILGITAAWWALALWPVGVEPEWLSRTRAACFGARESGLPDAGGWILLVGEPMGMIGMLVAGWGRSLRRDLQAMMASRLGRILGVSVAALAIIGVWSAGVRVRHAYATTLASDGTVVQKHLDLTVPSVQLTDQHGRLTSLDGFRGRTVLLTFAFGHCSTVCPVGVSALRAARDAANRPDVPVVVITLDPWRDTPDRLRAIAEHWGLDADDRVLSGDSVEVERALDALGIGRRRDERTGDVMHGQTVIGIGAKGRIVWRADGGRTGVDEFLRRS